AYKQAANLQPDLAAAHGALGSIYFQEGKLDKAVEEFEAAIRINPQLGVAYQSLAQVYMEQGAKLDEAIELAQKATQLNPTGPSLDTLAQAYYCKKMYTEAEEAIRRALTLEPGNQLYQKHLALILNARSQ
ncbi:TPA: tetratricopeptide repeat protein, partial [Candidatus Poribacteria bacterium]|nr:tetratricopeptide repeat protein [Candidatus Poribacteria bacterium]